MNFFRKLKLARLTRKLKKKVNEDEREYILSTIKKGQTAFDIGAHTGAFTYFMQQAVGENGKVYAFEPQSSPRKLFLQNKELLSWENVVVNNLALSDSKGSTTLHVPSYKGKEDSEGATILVHPDKKLYTTETVTTDTIDSFCKQHNLSPSFIKIDVEGNELKVLQGSVDTINKYNPKFFVEIEARHCGEEQALKTFELLNGLGYKCWIFLKNERVSLEQFNIYEVMRVPYCNNFIFEKDKITDA
jgi:FkbM family methyltransferase